LTAVSGSERPPLADTAALQRAEARAICHRPAVPFILAEAEVAAAALCPAAPQPPKAEEALLAEQQQRIDASRAASDAAAVSSGGRSRTPLQTAADGS